MNKIAEKQADNERQEAKPPGRRRFRKSSGLLIIALFFFSMVWLTRHEAISTIDCTPEIINGKPDIIMLGAWWCSYCHQAKRYFQKNNINYCEYDMENTATGKRLYQEHGAGAVPILLIGKYQLSGFNQQQIEMALSLLKSQQNIQP